MSERSIKSSRFLFVSRALVIAAVLVSGIGVVISWRQYQENKTAVKDAEERPIAGAPVVNESPAPSTEKPNKSAFDAYQVSPAAPRYIFIPNISVEAMIRPVGVDSTGRIAAPTNVYDAGWYTQSALPGQAGTMVVDGHLSSWEIEGVFYNVKKLKIGDVITIERGDGVKLNYKVAETHTYDADHVDMEAVLRPINPDKPGLNLITCAGKVIKGTNDFDRRIVVFAELAQ